MSDQNQRVWPYHASLILYVILWATRNVLTANILHDYDVLAFTFLIAIFAVGFIIPLRLLSVGFSVDYDLRQALPSFLVLGIATSVALIGMNFALAQISPVLFSLIDVSIYPIFASVMAYLFAKGENINLRVMIPVLMLATTGIMLFNMQNLGGVQNALSIQGLLLAVLSELGWATSIVVVANLVRIGTPVTDLIGFRFLISAIVLGLLLLVTPNTLVWEQPGIVAGIALFGYVIPFVLSFSSLRKLSVTTFAIYVMLIPLVTYIISAVVFNEWRLSLFQILGTGLVFVSLILRIVTEQRVNNT